MFKTEILAFIFISVLLNSCVVSQSNNLVEKNNLTQEPQYHLITKVDCYGNYFEISIEKGNQTNIDAKELRFQLDKKDSICEALPDVRNLNDSIRCVINTNGTEGNHTLEIYSNNSRINYRTNTSCKTTPLSIYNESKNILNGAIEPQVEYEKKLSMFLEWAKKYNITIVGTNKTSNELYFNGLKPGELFEVKDTTGILEVAEGLYKIPRHLTRVMNNKTIYLSSRGGRGYTILSSWPDQNILAGVNRGFILEQPITEDDAIHEFAHILDYHGIQGVYDDKESHWRNLQQERNDIFVVKVKYNPRAKEPPEGYIDVYSTANDAENFAQHFTAYILYPEEFRRRAENEPLLKQKYNFFKYKIFNGVEY